MLDPEEAFSHPFAIAVIDDDADSDHEPQRCHGPEKSSGPFPVWHRRDDGEEDHRDEDRGRCDRHCPDKLCERTTLRAVFPVRRSHACIAGFSRFQSALVRPPSAGPPTALRGFVFLRFPVRFRCIGGRTSALRYWRCRGQLSGDISTLDIFETDQLEGVDLRRGIGVEHPAARRGQRPGNGTPASDMQILAGIRQVVPVAGLLISREEVIGIILFFDDLEDDAVPLLGPIDDLDIVAIDAEQVNRLVAEIVRPGASMAAGRYRLGAHCRGKASQRVKVDDPRRFADIAQRLDQLRPEQKRPNAQGFGIRDELSDLSTPDQNPAIGRRKSRPLWRCE